MPIYACIVFVFVLFGRAFPVIFQDQGRRSDRRARADGARGLANRERGGVLGAGFRRTVGRCSRLEGQKGYIRIRRAEFRKRLAGNNKRKIRLYVFVCVP